MLRRSLVIALVILLAESCMTFYQKNVIFQEEFARNEYEKALKTLDNNKYIQKPKNYLLFLFDKGVTLQMMGMYEESNVIFEEAYIFIDDFQRSLGGEALSTFTNEMARDYAGEDFERIFIHYYKAMNFIMLNNIDDALVEIRRINIKLNEYNDKYKGENKFKRDAFAHLLMGLLYEAAGDENNAFIAYRNSYDIYSEDYKKFFNMNAPEQLKKDLIRMAAKNGMYDDQEEYEKKFDLKLADIPKSEKDLVFLWHNGLGPVKDEWSVNFVIVPGAGGAIVFENEELGMSFAFSARSKDEQASLSDLRVVRVAFPKFLVRNQIYSGSTVQSNGKDFKLEMIENVDEIAVKTLHDRVLRDLSKTLLRVALKQAAEAAARKENEYAGLAVGLFNAATEKADTRNWQTLPGKIYYARVPLQGDSSIITINTFKGSQKVIEAKRDVYVRGKMGFSMYNTVSIESLAIKPN